jgi:hypothetical protein
MLNSAYIMGVLGIEDATKANLIDKIIPGAIEKAFKAVNNYAHVPGMTIESWGISFDADARTITDDNGNFTGYYTHENGITPLKFQPDMFIHIQGSVLNDRIFEIASVNTNVIMVKSGSTIYDEAKGSLIKVTMVNLDEGYKLAIAQYIAAILVLQYGMKSENIGNYSASYQSLSEAESTIFKGYRKVSFI